MEEEGWDGGDMRWRWQQSDLKKRLETAAEVGTNAVATDLLRRMHHAWRWGGSEI